MGENKESEILVELREEVAIITLNRPKVYNALGRTHKLELAEYFKRFSTHPEIKVIVLTAKGKAFCTGQDLNDRHISAQSDATPVDLGKTLKEEWNPLVQSIRECDRPVICAVNGVCAGAGISVALSADLVIAHPDVKFVSGFTKIGLIPDAGSSHRFSRALGPQKAFEFFCFNHPLMPHELEEKGLINRVEINPLNFALTWAKEMAKMAPLSLRELKKNLQAGGDLAFNDILEWEARSQKRLGESFDYKEGVAAFLEKRPPQFRGE